jgi:hypothetical protein
MNELTAVFDQWRRPNYERRVRGTATLTYLWGSSGINQNITFDKPLILHIRNDLFGEIIALGTAATAVQTPQTPVGALGTLHPGECVSIPVQGLSGVYATCPPTASGEQLESIVACLITESG